ncbi:heavy metal translocating P-type ATPase metal-binding domain-containing protein [Ferruginibacter lapsinanis]|uniref:heavy metal translocating P-type ATPase n=1 Tax=Ferruginibacter lapsinanis TaxID=563172 RepID=UPI001E3D8AB7|nr:heavy metal translocating P-type ATPase metal-binding domain-containing protein [Ferruginibacter lapsinanis]UEG51328.1 heavy metal translocating P-type ATPase metal-binding domain-containing protein [Ferruginibacter lapsinanis]
MAPPCYHCGENCNEVIVAEEKNFCCEGCKQVYLLLNENNLCNYYNLDKNPGIKAKGKFISERFAYLDDIATQQKLIQFSSDTQTNVTFQLPQMHCSSCIFLLENLHRIEPGITKSQTNFQRKEVFIIFNPQLISLRKVVELLAFIGYEPYISLKDTTEKRSGTFNKKRIYKIGVAGFCFSNIMMLSFPEYFSAGHIEQKGLKETFTWLIFFLSTPVLFFAASDFFVSAWKGLRQKTLNIDAPIALAIVVTFFRSYYEIITGTGAGYLDSGCGIVFFMLVGRWFQDKTYDSLSFDRDYRSYFPLGVTVIENDVEKNIPVTQLQKNSRIIIRNEEMIPADAVLMKGNANVDYSFVSGENTPVQKNKGELIYAGGKQLGTAIELEIVSDVSQSYITQLWNNDIFTHKKNADKSFIHPWSKYFTIVLFSIALTASVYWLMVDSTKLFPALSAVLIVACPCSLLLSATFTYGNMLRIFGKNKLYLKNSSVIEMMAKINTIVFDKTGTITQNKAAAVSYEGTPLSLAELTAIKEITRQSSHPLSKNIAGSLTAIPDRQVSVRSFKEYSGKGVEALVDNIAVKIGSSAFISENSQALISHDTGTHVHVMLNDVHMGSYTIGNQYRNGLGDLVKDLRSDHYRLCVLSGDNDTEKNTLSKIFGKNTDIQFYQSPQQKLEYISSLQKDNTKVLMLGDGLNDAGALMQSDVGIAVSDNNARFSPACDAIITGENVHLLGRFLSYARSGKHIVTASFILSILYNIVGISFAVQAKLSPMIAAILMPASSISIVLLVSILTSLIANKKGL